MPHKFSSTMASASPTSSSCLSICQSSSTSSASSSASLSSTKIVLSSSPSCSSPLAFSKMPMPSLSKVPVPLSSFPAFWRRRLLPLLLAAFLLLFSSPISSAHLQPRSSCAAHFLNGEAAHTTEAVLPIKSSSGNIFWLLCHFPTLSSRLISVRPSLSTDVHNALAGQWWTPPPPAAEEGIKNADGGKVIGIGYQVSEWQFMRSLITESFDCKQRMCIRWPDGTNGRPAAENQQQMFTMETFSGQSISVRRNQSGSDAFHDECVLVPSPPLIRLRLPLPRGIAFYLEPLTCRQKEVPPSECHFELRTDSDRVRVRLDALRNKWPKGILSFSFRTSKPNGRLLELGTGQSSITGVDLIDGYLLLVNHIVHPVRLLADGTWHSLNLDLHSMALRVDGQGTAISLVGGGSPVPTFEWMFILLVGEVGAFRLVEMPELVDQGNSTQLLCQKGRTNSEEQFIDMIERPQKLVFEPLFGGSTVCASKNNFCNCKGPNSALSHGVHQTAECAESVSTENAFHLSRFADRLAFFIVPKFGPRFPISVLLQSEESTGLVLFGVYTLPRPAFGELGGRVQVHFVGDTVYGSFCSAFADGTERCLSCAIRRPKAFPSPDWVRFSLFYQQNLQFLAVDRQVCLLSPNSDAVDAAELYKITETNVLFVGGTFYAKIGAGLGQRVSDSFRRQFQDNTREKAPSIQGCIAEIVVKRQPQHLDTLFELQKRRAARTVHPGDQIFAMRRGCANCALGCDGAPCVRAGHGQQSECQCGQIYAITDLHDARCGWTQIGANPNGAIKSEADDDGSTQQTPSEEHDAAVPLPHWSLSVPIRHPLAPGVRRPKHLDRVWTLFRMPDANSELKTFLRIGGVRINVGNNGQQLVVEVPEFAIREEFTLRQGADSRLHLLSLELSPSVDTGYTTSSLTIRLDNDRRKLFGYAEIPLAVTASPSHHLHDAGSVIEIGPAILPEGKSSGAVPPAAEGDTAGGGGCIAALVFNYVPTDEGIFADEQKSLPSFVQIDYVPLFRHILQEQQHKNATFWWASAIVAAGDGKCLGNVVDPTIWETNSTSWGRVWVMDNSNDEEMNRLLFSGQTPPGNGRGVGRSRTKLSRRNTAEANNTAADGTWSTRLSLLVTTILVAVILLTLLLYGIMRCRNRRRFRCDAANCKQLKNGVFAARIEQQTKQTEEKRPLRSNEEEGDGYGKASQKQQHLLTKTQEATNNSEIWRNGGGNFTNGFVDQRQIGHADDHGGGRSAIATALVNSNGNTEMVVEQLDGSPKYSGGVGGNGILPPTKSDDRNFIATPLLHGQQQHQRRRMLIPAVADTSHVNGGKYCSNLTGPNSTAKDQTNDQQHEFLMRNATPIRVLMANGGNSSSQSSLVAAIGTKSDAKRTAQQQKQCQLRSDQPADQTPCAPIAQKDEL